MGFLEGLRGLVTETKTTHMAIERAQAAENMVEILTESMADAELMLEDTGWRRLTTQAATEFTRDGLQRAAEVSRVMAVADTLINRGLALRHAYIHGGGVTISADDTGLDGTEDVNSLIQAIIDDAGNQRSVFGPQAHETLERALGTDGNVFIACFTNPLTGYVQTRVIPFDEIQDVITNPEDSSEPWFYERQYVETTTDFATGQASTVTRTAYYPAVGHYPSQRVKTIGGHEVHWDAPIVHVSVNGLTGWKFGIGDAYTALTWARLYRDFLLDWATLIKALSQFAWKATGKSSKADKLRKALQRRPGAASGPDGNPNNVGATFYGDPETSLEAIPKTGATIDSESGRPIATLIATAFGVPVTTLLADPGQTGARAVAETLNTPTRLIMEQRREVWAEAYRAILGHAIRAAIKAPRGPLQGTFARDPYSGRETVTLAGASTGTINIDWPSLDDELPVDVVMKAVQLADSTGTMPKLEILKLILSAFNVENVDEVLAMVTDENGTFIDPYVSAGNAAVDAYRKGQDPATVA